MYLNVYLEAKEGERCYVGGGQWYEQCAEGLRCVGKALETAGVGTCARDGMLQIIANVCIYIYIYIYIYWFRI